MSKKYSTHSGLDIQKQLLKNFLRKFHREVSKHTRDNDQ